MPRLSASGLGTEVVISVPGPAACCRRCAVNVITSYSISTSKFGTGDTAELSNSAWCVVRLRKIRRPASRGHRHQEPHFDARDRRRRCTRSRCDRFASDLVARIRSNKIAVRTIVIFTFTGHPRNAGLASPASFGCIRMRSKDVIALYDATAHRRARDGFTKNAIARSCSSGRIEFVGSH